MVIELRKITNQHFIEDLKGYLKIVVEPEAWEMLVSTSLFFCIPLRFFWFWASDLFPLRHLRLPVDFFSKVHAFHFHFEWLVNSLLHTMTPKLKFPKTQWSISPQFHLLQFIETIKQNLLWFPVPLQSYL